MGRNSVFVVLLLMIFSGCKTGKFVFQDNEFERLKQAEVLENISANNSNIKNVFFRRSSIKMDSEKGIQTFRSNIFIYPDSFIRVSVLAPMGIELARISFEDNRIRILDRMNRVVIYSNYNEVYNKFGAHLNFDMLQNILLDRAFSYHLSKGISLEDYHFSIDENQYFLSSMKERQYQKLVSKRQFEDVVYQRIWIDPSLFLMRRTKLALSEKSINLDIKYGEYIKQDIVGYFPESIKIVGNDEQQNQVTVTISHSNIRFNDDNGISFKIPNKYEKIYR
ncbi:DUF4292 domain-containing protein [Marinilabilia rubra]|uniref:DUF4292 domain-containing protein n=2 Tax=Marinilabilia rubra TaxID=2162893 RepID=A0A2U2B9L0_9BACT|nr:DUF4292 domain-containing protein [Marinilabilia rubra]